MSNATATVTAPQIPSASLPPLYRPPTPTRFPLHIRYKHTRGRLLIIGDVHGCVRELKELCEQERIQPGEDMVILAGDLVGKGPRSKEVIEFMMEHKYLALVGNHDVYLLRCALLADRLDGKNYQSNDELGWWNESEVKRVGVDTEEYARTYYAKMNGFHSIAKKTAQHYQIAESLTDEQITWLATLPLSITIDPFSYTVVHAGLVPNIILEEQHPFHLTTMRNLIPGTLEPTDTLKVGEAWSMYLPSEGKKDATPIVETAGTIGSPTPFEPPGELPAAPAAAASVSCSDDTVQARSIVFGHDAQRGFQRPNALRLGLDTGCCNGKFLTGLVLPGEHIVHVRAHEIYSAPSGLADLARPPPDPSGVTLTPQLIVEPAIPRASSAAAPLTIVKTTPI